MGRQLELTTAGWRERLVCDDCGAALHGTLHLEQREDGERHTHAGTCPKVNNCAHDEVTR